MYCGSLDGILCLFFNLGFFTKYSVGEERVYLGVEEGFLVILDLVRGYGNVNMWVQIFFIRAGKHLGAKGLFFYSHFL